MPAERLDRGVADLEIAPGRGAQILGIEPAGELRRADHVAIERGDLTPLDAAHGARRGRPHDVDPLGDHAHQALAWTERHSPGFEVRLGDFAKRLVIDLLQGEQLAESAEIRPIAANRRWR